MESEIIALRDKRLEHAIVGISAKIATVIVMAEKGKTMPAVWLDILIETQLELEDMYIQL